MAGMRMPEKYVAEMICDRIAASKNYMGDKYTDASAWEYYDRSKDHYILHPDTRAQLETALTILKDRGEGRLLPLYPHGAAGQAGFESGGAASRPQRKGERPCLSNLSKLILQSLTWPTGSLSLMPARPPWPRQPPTWAASRPASPRRWPLWWRATRCWWSLPATARWTIPALKAAFHTKAAMVRPDQLVEQVGHPMGGVCPFAIRDDVPVYLDESLKRFDVVYPAAGTASSAVRLDRAGAGAQRAELCRLGGYSPKAGAPRADAPAAQRTAGQHKAAGPPGWRPAAFYLPAPGRGLPGGQPAV